jgi:hypothetical protein
MLLPLGERGITITSLYFSIEAKLIATVSHCKRQSDVSTEPASLVIILKTLRKQMTKGGPETGNRALTKDEDLKLPRCTLVAVEAC